MEFRILDRNTGRSIGALSGRFGAGLSGHCPLVGLSVDDFDVLPQVAPLRGQVVAVRALLILHLVVHGLDVKPVA